MSGSAEPPIQVERRVLLHYADVYDQLHEGETYSASDFVKWFLHAVKLESGTRPYHAPAGRPKQTEAEDYHPRKLKASTVAA